MTLKEIWGPIQPYLQDFDKTFHRSVQSKTPLVDLVARYIIKRKGKRVRPVLVLLSAELCGGVNERSYRGAALVEILHTATLIHDDVIDEADTRRGFASINATWKNKIAILMGDYLLAKGLLLCLESDDFEFLKITSTAVKRMSEGEIHQVQKSRQLDTDEETYLRIIADKTASLLSSCCEIGAASATEDRKKRQLLRDYGENVGIAFQIRDDLLDYIGRRSITGKPVGLDLNDKKLTLPIIYSLGQAPRKKGKEMIAIIKNGGKKIKGRDVKEVLGFVTEYHGLEYAAKRAVHFASLAKTLISEFPDSPSKRSLMSFADFVVERDK